MDNEHDNVEILDDEEKITLYDDDGKPVEFYEVACVEYEEEFYALLEPAEPMEGLEEGDVLIFKIEEQQDGTDTFMPVEDEELLNAVFGEYLKSAECDCDCSECGGGCHDEDCDCEDCKDER